jgi:hypothetical protein
VSEGIHVISARFLGGKDGGVAGGELAAALAFQGAEHDGGPAGGVHRANLLVDEGHDLVGQPNGNLRTHTKVVPGWDAVCTQSLDTLSFARTGN